MKNIKLIRLTSGEEIIADVNLNGIDTDTIIMTDAIVLIPEDPKMVSKSI